MAAGDVGAEAPAGTGAVDSGMPARAARLRRGFRIYASSRNDDRRTRRATDVILLVVGLLGLWLLTAAYPPSSFETSFENFLASFPGWLDPIWGICYDLLWLWAILLVIAAAISRRRVVAVQALAALVLGAVVALVVSRLALGSLRAEDDTGVE